jgi:hypothetical protein
MQAYAMPCAMGRLPLSPGATILRPMAREQEFRHTKAQGACRDSVAGAVRELGHDWQGGDYTDGRVHIQNSTPVVMAAGR